MTVRYICTETHTRTIPGATMRFGNDVVTVPEEQYTVTRGTVAKAKNKQDRAFYESSPYWREGSY